MQAVEINLVAFKRVPFGGASGTEDFIEAGDLSAATFRMEIRTAPGDTGDALVRLTNAAAGSRGISAAYDSAYPHPTSGAPIAATVIRPQIDEATLEALAAASPASDDLVLHYDLHITPSGGLKYVCAYGTFTIKPGVTI
ncbi:MAG: hypothetical protein AB7G24_00745 [Novosphingobium sp.]